MKCKDVREMLVAYLDNEVSASESKLIQLHLAECQECQAEFAELQETQNRIRVELKVMLNRAVPPDIAWERINAHLGDRSMSLKKNVSKSRRRLAFIAVIVVLMVAGLFAFSKPVMAGVEEFISRLFYVESVGGEGKMTFAFEPLMPSPIPERMIMDTMLTGETEEGLIIELRYFNYEEFVVIYETPAMDGQSLPVGTAITVSDHPAVVIENLSGVVELMSGNPQPGHPAISRGGGGGGGGGGEGEMPPSPPPERLDYTNAHQIVWVQNGVRIEMLSNLPYDETRTIAESLVAAEPVGEE